jgi:hypothetical protein
MAVIQADELGKQLRTNAPMDTPDAGKYTVGIRVNLASEVLQPVNASEKLFDVDDAIEPASHNDGIKNLLENLSISHQSPPRIAGPTRS